MQWLELRPVPAVQGPQLTQAGQLQRAARPLRLLLHQPARAQGLQRAPALGGGGKPGQCNLLVQQLHVECYHIKMFVCTRLNK